MFHYSSDTTHFITNTIQPTKQRKFNIAPFVTAGGKAVPMLGGGIMVITRKNTFSVSYDVLHGNYIGTFGVLLWK